MARRHLRLSAASSVLAALATAAALVPSPAAAKVQRVHVYSVTLDFKAGLNAHEVENGWSHVDTVTDLNGRIRARVDGVTFVDGVPQQTELPFTEASADELWEAQESHYTSPLGTDEGRCREASPVGRPEGDFGLISTSVGANAEDGTRQISLAAKSPSKVWIHKTCTGYLKYEVADPLIDESLFSHAYFPMAKIGLGTFRVPFEGQLGCPGFIRIQNCSGQDARGNLIFDLQATYDRGEPDPVKPAPVVVPPKDESPKELERFLLQVMIRRAHEENRYGQAVVRCGKPCEGGVSAYAIALSKQGKAKGQPKKIGETTFRSDASGNAEPTVPLSKGGRQLADRRGAIEYRVEAKPVGGGNVATSIARAKLGRH